MVLFGTGMRALLVAKLISGEVLVVGTGVRNKGNRSMIEVYPNLFVGGMNDYLILCLQAVCEPDVEIRFDPVACKNEKHLEATAQKGAI